MKGISGQKKPYKENSSIKNSSIEAKEPFDIQQLCFQIIYKQYDQLHEAASKYYDYMYRVIYFSILAFSAVFAFGFSGDPQSKTIPLQFQVAFYYVLPIFSYVFGLLLAYIAFVLAQNGYMFVIQEQKIKDWLKEIHQEGIFTSWVTYVKQSGKGNFIFSYGPMLVLYLVLPWISIAFVKSQTNFLFVPIQHQELFSYIPFFTSVVYIVFMLKLILGILHFAKITKSHTKGLSAIN